MPPAAAAPSTPVRVVPADFHSVAQRFVDAQGGLEQIRQDFLKALDAASGAAGACDGARQYQNGWAAAMDSIVNDGFRTAFDLLGSIGKGIDVSALNHVGADQSSVPGKPGGPPRAPLTPQQWPGNTDFPVLTGESPWWMPGFLEKYIPTADTGRLDDAATACRNAGGAVQDLVNGLHAQLQSLVGNNTSDDLTALEQFWQRAAGPQSILAELPAVLGKLGESLVDFRVWNVDTQQKTKDKIKEVVDDMAVVGVIIVIGSIATDGALDVLIAAVIEGLELFGVDAAGALVAPIAEVVTAAEAILITAGGAIAITQGVVPAMQTAMSSTPNPNIESADATKISDQVSGHTEPARAPDPNAKPGGHPTKIPERADPTTRRGLERENESADILARAGYDVEQNPGEMPNGTKPDYRINGKIFDNYAPSADAPRSIATAIEKKVGRQADHIVVNLGDSPVTAEALSEQLKTWPIQGLKEVIAVDRNGTIVHLFP